MAQEAFCDGIKHYTPCSPVHRSSRCDRARSRIILPLDHGARNNLDRPPGKANASTTQLAFSCLSRLPPTPLCSLVPLLEGDRDPTPCPQSPCSEPKEKNTIVAMMEGFRPAVVEDEKSFVHVIGGNCYQSAPQPSLAGGLALGRKGVVGVDKRRYAKTAMKHAKTDSHKIAQDVLVALHQRILKLVCGSYSDGLGGRASSAGTVSSGFETSSGVLKCRCSCCLGTRRR